MDGLYAKSASFGPVLRETTPSRGRGGLDLGFYVDILSRLTLRFPRVIGNIAWRGESGNALIALGEEGPLEQAAALVMQKIFIPAILDERGDNNDDTAMRMFCGQFKNVLHEWDDHETIRRRKDLESGGILARFAERCFDVALPLLVQKFGMLTWFDMNGDDFRGDARGEFEGVLGDAAPMVDGNDGDGRGGVVGGLDWRGTGGR